MNGQVRRTLTLVVALILVATVAVAFQQPPGGNGLVDFDLRRKSERPSVSAAQEAAVAQLRARVPKVRVDFDPLTTSPRWVGSVNGFLTQAVRPMQSAPTGASAMVTTVDPNLPVKSFLDEYRDLFGHGSESLSQTRVVREYVTAHNGMRTVAWQQEVDGIPVFEAVLVAHTTSRGELVNISSGFVPDPVVAASIGTSNRAALIASPPISGATAVAAAAQSLGEKTIWSEVESLGEAAGAERKQHFRAPQLRGDTVISFVWLPVKREEVRLCWDVILTSRLRGEMFRVLLDAQTGEVIVRRGLTRYISDASYRVYTSDSPSPFSPGHSTPLTSQPALIDRVLVTVPALSTNASPDGWIGDGLNETIGNNVDAHADRDDDDFPDLPRPVGSPFRVFDFAIDPATQDPTNYTPAAVVQLFYLCNLYHDKLYELGFTEAAGNFQVDNFGRGGFGNDPVMADAQDGGGVNNANFSTPPDGFSGRMQMYVFSGPSPRRDGDLDAEIVFHEFSHGLSWRLVGGGQGLGTSQSDGMGEGWSDFYGLALLSEPGDDVHGCYAAGGYATHQFFGLAQNYYYGIRRYPYSTDLSKNPLTFKDIDTLLASPHAGIPRSSIIGNNPSEVHNQGEVWCVTLWEARANLIDKYGWALGNQLILQLVTDGMKLTAAAPDFLQARDAILQADLVNTGGANHAELWEAFAKRGMGVSAISPVSTSNTGIVEAYDVPDDLSITPGLVLSVAGNLGGPFYPHSASFVLTNQGSAPINWSLQNTSTWINIAPSNGVLLPGGPSATVSVTIDPVAETFLLGSYPNLLRFTNHTSGVVQSRTFELSVAGFGVTDDFDPGIDLSQWTAFGGILGSTVHATNYGGYVSAPNSLWFDDAGSRFATTIPVDTRGGGTISFSVRLADGASAPWEQADGLPIEGVVLECSTNAGSSWTWLGSYDTSAYYNWTPESMSIPAAAQSAATRFRWRQKSNSGTGYDHWALDDVSINALPLQFLELAIPANTVEGVPYVTGSVTVSPAPLTDTTVNLNSSDDSEAVPLSPIIILAGETNADVILYIGDDSELDGSQTVTISASAMGYQNSQSSLTVDDNETAALAVVLPASSIEGAVGVFGNVRITNAVPNANILVTLSTSDPTEIQVPATVQIPAGQTSAVFAVTVVNDSLIDGAQSAAVTAHVANWSNGVSSMTVLDNETLDLSLSLPATAYENAGVLTGAGQVRISGALSSNLTVSLFSSDLTEVTVPATAIIPAGQTSANFNLTMVDDGIPDGVQSVSVAGAAPGFVTGSNSLPVLDDEIVVVPDGLTVLADSCGGGNGVIDPNEVVTVQFGLRNIGTFSTSNLVATLLTSGGVVAPAVSRSFGALLAGGAAVSNSFSLVATGSCSGAIVATLQLQDGSNNLGSVSFDFQLGAQDVFLAENFDSVSTPTLPDGWTAAFTGSGAPWSTSINLRDSLPNAAFAPNPAASCNNGLTSPAFLVSSTPAQLTFRHAYNTEPCCDGGVLEISIAGGAFTDILSAGGNFVTNGYTVGNSWRGTSSGFPSFVTTVANLPPAALGQSVQLRWRFFADMSVSGIGWYVDNIRVTGDFACCSVPPTPAIVSQPADTNADVGNNVSFTVMVSGSWPMSFQWQRDGVNLPSGTNQTLSIIGLTTNDSGGYSVLVSNAYGSVASSKAHLSVAPPEIINSQVITIADASAAFPYPSTIAVSGMTGAVANVTVTLRGVNHSFPDDLDVLLVSPSGANTLLMSDAGGFADLNDATLLFDDGAVNSLPDAGQILSGSYRPTNFGSGDVFPAPAPAGSYGTNFAALKGTDPNGLWKLFVYDDEAGDAGSISAGWTLRINLAPVTAPEFLPIQLSAGQIQLRFATVIGRSYMVQYKNSLTDAVWTDLQPVSGDGTIKTLLDSVTGTARFYRLRTP